MMIDSISRLRPLMLLAMVVLAQVLLLAFQIKGEQNVPLIRYWAVTLLTPLERGTTATFSSVGSIWKGYVGLRNARSENEKMRSELQRLQLRNQELESQTAEAQRLVGLLNFRDAHPETEMLAAEVIGSSSDSASQTIFINRGEKDRVKVNYGVITPDGVIGKIVDVFPHTAEILLINDKDSGVGALFAATRTHGVVRGSGDPEPHLDYVINEEKVLPGQIILTSGEDKIFPKDLLIGTVESAKPGNPFQSIRIAPAARLDRLEDVIVLLSSHDFVSSKSDNISGTAAKQTAATAAAAEAAKAQVDAGATSAQPPQAPASNQPATQRSNSTPAANTGAAKPQAPQL